ncbi:phage tail protein [Anaerocolumna sp. AGMB13025]|uniref:phage tail protein n=1 Tax=Anaerocolumna sp. AGMB13025 TaxID=3039116 RepID=UPI00241CD765|nr:phage tail protein [Anaerocolumna sp. AGMB13025]WFR57581.1 phage tail protein [Anaerocolumna sp. AGMB13025]
MNRYVINKIQKEGITLEVYTGTIRLYPYNYSPRGWILCNGAKFNIAQSIALFQLIGFTYGGDNKTYFNIPNLIGAEPDPNLKYYMAIDGYYPVGS